MAALGVVAGAGDQQHRAAGRQLSLLFIFFGFPGHQGHQREFQQPCVGRSSGLRRSLVVFQFVLSIVLITGIVVIYSQLNYIKNKDLGFEKNQKLIFNMYTAGINLSVLMDDFRALSEVKAVTKSNSQLGKPVLQDWIIYQSGGDPATGLDVEVMVSDKYFARTAGIRFAGGRDFRDFDSGKVLINETLAKKLRIDPAKSEGALLYSKDGDNTVTYSVAGVMKDFHFSSLHDEMKPLLLMYYPKSPSLCDIMLSCNSSNYTALLAKMETIWRKDVPGVPFGYSFLDDEVQKQYETEITLSHIINSFTGMAILISCLGLFGLAAFSAEQRSKEISIRKVLGASVSGIVQLLSRDFLKLVGIAMIIAIPISWWAMNKWLGWDFCLPGGCKLVDVCHCQPAYWYRTVYYQLPGHQSGAGQPAKNLVSD